MLQRYALLSRSLLLAATAGCKPALPTGDTSTLPGTLKLIQDILNESGKAELVNHAYGRTATMTFEVTRAKRDLQRCGVGYHVRSTIDGMILYDRDGKIVFSHLANLTVESAEDYFKDSDPSANPKVTPPTYVLKAQPDAIGEQAKQGDVFVFSDKAWADALKDAMGKAVTFCAAKN